MKCFKHSGLIVGGLVDHVIIYMNITLYILYNIEILFNIVISLQFIFNMW